MKPPPEKPFYSSITIIILSPLLIFLLAIAAIVFLGMITINENRIDKFVHVIGGTSICFSVAGVLWHLVHRKIVTLQDANVFRALVFGFVCFAVISWEILEYILIFPIYTSIFPNVTEYVTYFDTITDMISGLIGGLLAMIFIRQPIG
jgi:hypothetical protein